MKLIKFKDSAGDITNVPASSILFYTYFGGKVIVTYNILSNSNPYKMSYDCEDGGIDEYFSDSDSVKVDNTDYLNEVKVLREDLSEFKGKSIKSVIDLEKTLRAEIKKKSVSKAK